MKKIKRIIAAVVAAASIGALSLTASAEDDILLPPIDWMAIRANGAPSSINKTYSYKVVTYGFGYDITCTTMMGDYDRNVVVRKQFNVSVLGIQMPIDEHIVDLHSETSSPIFVENPSGVSDEYITFSFFANCDHNCNAYGVINHHK